MRSLRTDKHLLDFKGTWLLYKQHQYILNRKKKAFVQYFSIPYLRLLSKIEQKSS